MRGGVTGLTFVLLACSSFDAAERPTLPDDAGPDGSWADRDAAVEAAPPGDAAATSRYAEEVLKDTPIGYWRLGDTLPPKALDSSGNGRVGQYTGNFTLEQAGALEGDPDTAVLLDNPSGHVEVAEKNDVLGFVEQAPFTIELWAKPTKIDTVYRGVVTKELDPSPTPAPREGWGLYNQSTGLAFQRYCAGVPSTVSFPAPGIPLNKFSHVVVTYDGINLILYVDAVKKQTTSSMCPMSTHAGNFAIGARKGGTFAPFLGVIDEVAVYNSPLSPARISTHFEVARGR